MASLKQRTVSGVKWQVLNKVTQKVISVASFAVLARILEPSVFGLFALGFVAIDGFHILKSFGFDSALIQRKEDIKEAADTAYVIVQAQGILLFGVCFLIAPIATQFFKNPQIESVIRALGVIFIFSSFSKIPTTLLAKTMRFNLISIIDLAGSIINSLCAIGFAIISPTVWSLVWAYVIKQITVSIMSYFASGYRFGFHFNAKIAKELFGYGKFVVGLSVLSYVWGNLDNIVVGKILGVTLLGYYALSANIGNFINTHFMQALSGVMFPAYSSIQHDRAEVTRVYLKTTKFVSLISVPFSVALIFLAKELVLAMYGARWLEIVPLIRILGTMQLVVPILICSGSVFLGCGKPQFNYRIILWGLIIKIPCLIFFTSKWGLMGTVSTDVVTLLITSPIYIFFVRKIVSFKFLDFLKQFLPSIYCSLVMALVIQVVRMILSDYPLPIIFGRNTLGLLMLILSGFAAYFIAIFFIDRPSLREAVKLLLNRYSKGMNVSRA